MSSQTVVFSYSSSQFSSKRRKKSLTQLRKRPCPFIFYVDPRRHHYICIYPLILSMPAIVTPFYITLVKVYRFFCQYIIKRESLLLFKNKYCFKYIMILLENIFECHTLLKNYHKTIKLNIQKTEPDQDILSITHMSVPNHFLITNFYFLICILF